VRPPAPAAALLVLACVLAGCGGGGDSGTPEWQGRPEPRADGTVPVDDFVTFQQDVDERWERAPVLLAGEFVRLDERDAFRTTVDADAGPEAGGPATVTVTLDGLQDDSVAAERYVLRLRRDGETWILASATWGQRCRQGRGHQAFTPAACI
jgi:hypothetical protein